MKNHWLDKKKNETTEQTGVIITGDNEWVCYDYSHKYEYIPEEITVTPTDVTIGDICIGDGITVDCQTPICISGTPYPPEITIKSEIPKEIKVDWTTPFDFGKCEIKIQCPPSLKVYTRTLKLGSLEFKDDGKLGFDIFCLGMFTGSVPYDGEYTLFNWMKDKLHAEDNIVVLPGASSLGIDDGESEFDFCKKCCSPNKFTLHYDEPEHLNVCKAGLDLGISKRQLLQDIKLCDNAKKDIDNLAKAEIDDAIIENIKNTMIEKIDNLVKAEIDNAIIEDIKQNVGIIIESSSEHKILIDGDENYWPTGY